MSLFTPELLAPLLTVCRRLGARHLSLFGSATHKPLHEVADLDLHLVLPAVDRAAYAALVEAAGLTVRSLATAEGRAWRVELRHGPFKPSPDAGSILQLHLLVDDAASLELAPCVLRVHRTATGRHLFGKPLPTPTPTRTRRLREACAELTRWRDALAAREIAFRHWQLDPEPRLVEGRLPATTAWELHCLLRGAAVASDLHYLTTALSEPGVATDAVGPLLRQLGDEHRSWHTLADRWDRVAEQAVEILDRRLDHLARL